MDNVAKGRILVTLQFMLLGGLVLLSSNDLLANNVVSETVGWALEIFGLALVVMGFRGLGPSLTANPVPLDSAKLVTSGIYSRLRHPIYAGLILATLGMVIVNGSLIKLYFWVPLVVLLSIKMRFEEALLVTKYSNYKKYQAEVPAMLPKLKR